MYFVWVGDYFHNPLRADVPMPFQRAFAMPRRFGQQIESPPQS